ncbi:MAG: hypothetical protein ACRCWI_05175 [Brevinema sp.]
MKAYYFIILTLVFNISFAQSKNQAYILLQGLWSSPINENYDEEMDIIFNIDATGKYTLSVIPIFEYESMTREQQLDIIQKYVSTKGYFNIINIMNTSPEKTVAQTEILLNEEISTNILEITPSQIYIINTNNLKELFMKR